MESDPENRYYVNKARTSAQDQRFLEMATPTTRFISNTDIMKVFGRRFPLPAAQNDVKMPSESASLFSGDDRGKAEAGK